MCNLGHRVDEEEVEQIIREFKDKIIRPLIISDTIISTFMYEIQVQEVHVSVSILDAKAKGKS